MPKPSKNRLVSNLFTILLVFIMILSIVGLIKNRG